MYNNHKAVVQMIENHYYINGSQKLDDLNESDQRQLINLVLKDTDYFDPAEIILYNPEKDKNIISLLEDLRHGVINQEGFFYKFYELIINFTRPYINEIFDEVDNLFKLKTCVNRDIWIDEIDFIHGFF